jgi:hypothetical protein
MRGHRKVLRYVIFYSLLLINHVGVPVFCVALCSKVVESTSKFFRRLKATRTVLIPGSCWKHRLLVLQATAYLESAKASWRVAL